MTPPTPIFWVSEPLPVQCNYISGRNPLWLGMCLHGFVWGHPGKQPSCPGQSHTNLWGLKHIVAKINVTHYMAMLHGFAQSSVYFKTVLCVIIFQPPLYYTLVLPSTLPEMSNKAQVVLNCWGDWTPSSSLHLLLHLDEGDRPNCLNYCWGYFLL